MGNQVWFHLQDGVSDSQIAEANQRITEALKTYPGPKEGEDPILQYGFMLSRDLDDWITDINTNPKSPQAHLKPATHASLRQMFGMYATPGAMAIDTAYTRCPEDLACILADALVQEPLLARISSNGRDFLQKAGYSDDHPLARLIEPRVVVAPALNNESPGAASGWGCDVPGHKQQFCVHALWQRGSSTVYERRPVRGSAAQHPLP